MKKFIHVQFFPVLVALASLILFSGCCLLPSFEAKLPGNRAFIAHWHPTATGKALRLAVKDNIDMKGIVTTAGSQLFAKTHTPAEKDAPCLALAREEHVDIVGKANLTEFAVAPSGVNEYFGTPRNPFEWFRGLIPGGSSCGSAVAVADGAADIAFGTDTAGSIRVPAACCGIVGLKTTQGLVPVEGIYPIEPEHLDTVGPMGKDIARTVQGMDLLKRGFEGEFKAAVAARPSAQGIRVGRLRLNGTDPKIDAAIDRALAQTGFQVVQLDDSFQAQWDQAKKDGNTVAKAGAWITDNRFRYSWGISPATKSAILAGRIMYPIPYRRALARRQAWQHALREVFDKVDFIALPTMQNTPLQIPGGLRLGLLEARMLNVQNTVPVNLAGNPALAIPVPLHHEAFPVTSLQLIGPPLSEAQLLNAGRLVEGAVHVERYVWFHLPLE